MISAEIGSGGGPKVVLHNPVAGRRRWTPEAIRRALAAAGADIKVDHVNPVELRRRLSGRRVDAIVAVAGGDGTLRTAAQALAGTPSALLPVPAGRLNHFARRNGLPDMPAAAKTIRHPRIHAASLGRAGPHVFLNTAVLGDYARVVRLRQRLRRYVGIWPAATLAYLVEWFLWRQMELRISLPDRRINVRTTMLWVGLGAGSFPAPHEAPAADGGDELELVLVPGGRRRGFTLLAAAWRWYREKANPAPAPLPLFHAQRVGIDAPGPVPVTLDGEPFLLEPPFELSVWPDGLRVAGP